MSSKAGARSHRHLVIAQIAVTQPVIVGLVVIVFLALREYERMRPREGSDRLVAVQLGHSPGSGRVPAAYPAAAMGMQATAMRRLMDRLEHDPRVEKALHVPNESVTLDGYSPAPEDRSPAGLQEMLRLTASLVVPDFFSTTGREVMRGREFQLADAAYAKDRVTEIPVIVTDELANKLWPGLDPVGRKFIRGEESSSRGPAVLIVAGVVDATESDTGNPRDGYRVYLRADPLLLEQSFSLLVRTAIPPSPVIESIRHLVPQELPGLEVTSAQSSDQIDAAIRRYARLAVVVAASVATVALLLSALGIYGVVAHAVRQRRGEIAVRMALGARPARIARMFVREGLGLTAIGLFLGLPPSLVSLQFLTASLESDPVSITGVGVVALLSVLAVAGIATWIPATRAAAVDPAHALRD